MNIDVRIDYYAYLELTPQATMEEVKSAYRSLSLKHHPDKNGGDGERFKQIQSAYEILYDYHKRRAYDNKREQISRGMPPIGFPFGGGFPFTFNGGGQQVHVVFRR